ncbi:hypothetical protein DSO57_1009863 [Entomophthora muscae]|uniref:Uncharacterized protein n=1 Tax=Entomophthora muscae TaxID=34485 RepID=A0ACC2SJV0_9FUNG|nr:hypothetical protein DSO57_1009863 [Entomophthora muscae]
MKSSASSLQPSFPIYFGTYPAEQGTDCAFLQKLQTDPPRLFGDPVYSHLENGSVALDPTVDVAAPSMTSDHWISKKPAPLEILSKIEYPLKI